MGIVKLSKLVKLSLAQLALVEHFMSEPLSMLMQPCMGGESSLQHAVDEVAISTFSLTFTPHFFEMRLSQDAVFYQLASV